MPLYHHYIFTCVSTVLFSPSAYCCIIMEYSRCWSFQIIDYSKLLIIFLSKCSWIITRMLNACSVQRDAIKFYWIIIGFNKRSILFFNLAKESKNRSLKVWGYPSQHYMKSSFIILAVILILGMIQVLILQNSVWIILRRRNLG